MLHKNKLSLPLCFVVVLLTIFQSSCGDSPVGPVTDPYPGPCPNLCLDPIPIPQPFPQYVVIPQYIPTSGSIFANAASVTIFTNTFLEDVYTTDILRQVFDLSQTSAKEYADFVRKYTQKVLSELGIENAAALAEWAPRAIPLYFDVLPLPVVARAYANMAANFLFVDGYLGIDNAKDLGLAYAKAIADSAEINMNSNPRSKFLSLANGFVNYFFSVELYTKEKAALVTYYVGNEWYVAGVNYRLF